MRKSIYLSKIEKINNLIPDCCIGVDVIVGFPGEGEEDFITTQSFLHNLDILDIIHDNIYIMSHKYS